MSGFMYADLESDMAPQVDKIGAYEQPRRPQRAEVINHDLFDDVLQPTVGNRAVSRQPSNNYSVYARQPSYAQTPKSPLPSTHLKSKSSDIKEVSRSFICYVGGLTWWTTDDEIETAIVSIGVNDLLDIEIQEHENNGQSKGYAKVWCGSETSIKRIITQLGKLMINGKHPETQSKNIGRDYFEMKLNPASRGQPQEPPPKQNGRGGMHNKSSKSQLGSSIPTLNLLGSLPNPLTMGLPPPTSLPPGLASMLPGLPPPPSGHPSILSKVLSASGAIIPKPPTTPMEKPPSPPPPKPKDAPRPQLSLREFEALLDQNREICSSAISQALDFADQDEFTMALTTLQKSVDAVRLSRIADDDRSKALIGSVQETMMSIKEKQNPTFERSMTPRDSPVRRRYDSPSRSRSRSNSRSRSYSPEKRPRRYRKSRSRTPSRRRSPERSFERSPDRMIDRRSRSRSPTRVKRERERSRSRSRSRDRYGKRERSPRHNGSSKSKSRRDDDRRNRRR